MNKLEFPKVPSVGIIDILQDENMELLDFTIEMIDKKNGRVSLFCSMDDKEDQIRFFAWICSVIYRFQKHYWSDKK